MPVSKLLLGSHLSYFQRDNCVYLAVCVLWPWSWILLTSYVILVILLKLFKPEFCQLQNGDNNMTGYKKRRLKSDIKYLIEIFQVLKRIFRIANNISTTQGICISRLTISPQGRRLMIFPSNRYYRAVLVLPLQWKVTLGKFR